MKTKGKIRKQPWKFLMLWAILFVAHTAKAEDVTITDEAGLRALATAVNSGTTYAGQTVYLANDITLTEGDWTPIGTADNSFYGHFEGWGHKISGLSINASSNYQGLFGYIIGGSVRDVAVVTNCSITGALFVGAICGYLKNGGEISSCYSEASVTGIQYVGGICGKSEGIIRDCYVTGSVSFSESEAKTGGIVGYSSGNIQNCYMVGTISGSGNNSTYFGAIVGQEQQSGILQQCIYNNETTTTTLFAIGGDNDYTPAHDDEYNHVTGQKTETMKEEKFWKGELDETLDDFILNNEANNTVWKIVDGSYPLLYSFLKNEPLHFKFTSTKNWLTVVPNGNYAVPSEMEAYIVTAIDEGTLTLSRVYTLNEGRGALLYCETDVDKEFLAITTDGTLSDYSRDTWLKGSHVSPVTIGGTGHNDYILNSSTFYRAQSGSLARGKAYLRLDNAGARRDALNIRFDNEPTGVTELKSKETVQPAYDLGGRRVQGAPKRGMVIQNRTKTIRL